MPDIKYVNNVNQMSCYPGHGGETDVVFSVLWTMSGTDGTYNGSFSASTELTYKGGPDFTPYDQLTQDQVLGWVMNAVDPEYLKNMQAQIAKQIADQANPPVVTPPLPWNIPEEIVVETVL